MPDPRCPWISSIVAAPAASAAAVDGVQRDREASRYEQARALL